MESGGGQISRKKVLTTVSVSAVFHTVSRDEYSDMSYVSLACMLISPWADRISVPRKVAKLHQRRKFIICTGTNLFVTLKCISKEICDSLSN